ncbi:hypothetical protein [Maribacter sp. 2210JD10-5]|uniref:hypothetical protein n=1 Tax=Maribacter sp. 2210JD10-5 TaxID=3386272 RepID=UPI0039BD49A0
MKKLFVLGALAMGSLSVTAQDVAAVQEDATEIVEAAQDFTEIETSELPTAVTEAVAKNYPTSTINKAYVNGEKQYKLEVSLEDGTSGTLYADENGNWLDM